MPRYKLTVAYDGTNFFGWQKQRRPPATGIAAAQNVTAGNPPCPDSGGPLRTAQHVLEQAVRQVVREPISILGASRTDSGVHAIGQVAAFTCSQAIPLARLPLAINSRLPDDIQVRRAEVVAADFDPISDCISKSYRYRIAHGCALRCSGRPLFDRHFVTAVAHRLDVEAMHSAAQRLIGTHDFASFTRLHHGKESTVRTIHSCNVTAHPRRRRRLQIDISGSGFLYNMVRIIAGTLTEVGRGRYSAEKIDEILAAKDRTAAGPTMPPEGLCLRWVRYGEG